MADYFDKLKKLLGELFQLDQPDLDFGFYRIMHAKADQVKTFIERDLLKISKDAFGESDEVHKAKLQAAYDEAIQMAIKFKAPDPEETEPVKEAKAALDALKDNATAEKEIYEHLYRFFERYYDNGDFISRRYFARETPGKAAPFAVPYNGEEVKLHWANADQYYIKTTEYFSNYTFDLRQSAEVIKIRKEDVLPGIEDDDSPMRVHFRIIDASEGEHGNVKAADSSKRFFIIHRDKPVEILENGELSVNFEFRPDPEKTGQDGTWRDRRNGEAVNTVFVKMDEMAVTDENLSEYLRLLRTFAPTDKDKKRPLLAKYINQYTARNTMDYFIHKDLGSFLHREMDFYIKNEIMRLDDLENADVPTVESYLAKIKVFRKIAGKLIDFLAQLENFQKKLWLKKKFVIETNYCMTLDRVPEKFYPEIIANNEQHDEWVKLFAIDEIQADTTGNPGYSNPLTGEFLKANNKLVLDTAFFNEDFRTKLIASIQTLDEQCDGLIIHSENFQALNLLQERYREQVKCVYIDPPYNTSASEIIYKNSYKHSSWITLICDRIIKSQSLIGKDALFQVAIDDAENFQLKMLLDDIFGQENYVSTICIQHNPRGRADAKHISPSHEYLHLYSKDYFELITNQLLQSDEELGIKYSKSDSNSPYRELPFKRSGSNSRRQDRPNLFYSLYYNPKKDKLSLQQENEEYVEILPLDSNAEERVWRWGQEKASSLFDTEFIVKKNSNGAYTVNVKDRLKNTIKPKSFWYGAKYDASSYGTMLLKGLFDNPDFSYPKSINAVMDALFIGSNDNSLILDYFAGSGTTAHAVINLNREDDGNRKYILVEMEEYFDTVLKPRIQKVVYSRDWKDGKPVSREGSSHIFKYLRLESYEDTLNNLSFEYDPARMQYLDSNPSLKEDYMLHYMLKMETRGSQSLLNIDAFADPVAYTLRVKKPGSDEYVNHRVDLVETFNYLIGLRVDHIDEPRRFSGSFERKPDPDLPEDQQTKLVLKDRLKEDSGGAWSFRKIEGRIPKDPMNPDNGRWDKVLIIWRNLTGNMEEDNLMLDEWFKKNRIKTTDFEFDIIYVNGSNNLPNLIVEGDHWKVRLIEEEFMKRMWETEGV